MYSQQKKKRRSVLAQELKADQHLLRTLIFIGKLRPVSRQGFSFKFRQLSGSSLLSVGVFKQRIYPATCRQFPLMKPFISLGGIDQYKRHTLALSIFSKDADPGKGPQTVVGIEGLNLVSA